MKILITGARGMVGNDLCSTLKKEELITPPKHMLNVSNLKQVMTYKKDKPKIIFHLAAETDHEYCDINPSQCYLINTVGTGNMVKLAESLNATLVYLGAGSIFDGKKEEPYTNTDKPNPMNHYNISKYYGELIVRSYNKHYVVRAGWMFGGGKDLDKKFVNKIMNKVYAKQKSIKVCDDCIGSPTYSKDLCKWMNDVIVEGRYHGGVYHAVNTSDGVSRYEVACEMKKILKFRSKIVRCSIDDLKEEFPCKRTNYEVLRTNFSNFTRDWKLALKEYLNDKYRH